MSGGIPIWLSPSLSVWGLSGNAWTNPLTQFIGTTDNQDLVFKRNNIEGFRLSGASGNLVTMADATINGVTVGRGWNNNIFNLAVGISALSSASTSGWFNAAFGNYALSAKTTGANNTAIGDYSLNNLTTGSNNTALGYNTAGGITTGSGNTILGANVIGLAATLSNNIIIADGNGNRRINVSSTGAVGIGTNTPGYLLDVAWTGSFYNLRISSGATLGYVLTTDALGNASWQAAAGGGWGLSGNAWTNPLTQFIGTTDNQDLVFKTNNIERFRFYSGATANNIMASFSWSDILVNGLTVGRGSGNIVSNTAIGSGALYSNWTGAYNTAIGLNALSSNTSGWYNTANGSHSLISNTSGDYNTANGSYSLERNSTGSQNTANGLNTLRNNTIGIQNTANGTDALRFNTTGIQNTANGVMALNKNITGYSNIANGVRSLFNNINGSGNIAIGQDSLYDNITGSNNVALGYNTARGITTGSGNTILGANVTGLSATLSNNIIIADGNGNRRINVGATGAVGIGTNTPGYLLDVAWTGSFYNLRISSGATSGYVLTTDALGNASWQSASTNIWSLSGNSGTNPLTQFIGTTDNQDLVFKRNNIEGFRLSGASGNLMTTADAMINNITVGRGSGNIDTNTAIGSGALKNNGTGAVNVAVWFNSLNSNTTGYANTANGYYSLFSNTSGRDNTANGFVSLYSNTIGNFNTANGKWSLYFNSTGSYNTANGWYSLYDNISGMENTANGYLSLSSNTSGRDNTANGYNSLDSNTTGNNNTANWVTSLSDNTTGSNNTALGYNTAGGITTGSGNTILGANVTGLAATLSNNIIIADGNGNRRINVSSTGAVGIGTNTPGYLLDVAWTGSFYNLRISSGATSGYVLTTDALGNASWQSASTNIWSLSGNSGTNPLTQFIGTTDNQDLVFKRNNIEGFRLSGASGNLVTTADATINWLTIWQGSGGSDNIIFGENPFTSNIDGSLNIAIGTNSLVSNTGWSYNISIWESSLSSNTIGSHNLALGIGALGFNTTGNKNVAQGYNSLQSNDTGNDNTANWHAALEHNTTGSNNVANGAYAMRGNTTGSNNTVIGSQAWYWAWGSSFFSNNSLFGNQAGYGLTTGSNNIFMGYKAGESTTTGTKNIIIGYDIDTPTATGSNMLNIGNLIYGTGVNGTNTTLSTGNIGIWTSTPNYKLEVNGDINSIGTVRANGIALTSDARFKQGVTTISNSIDILSRLNPVTYTWNLLGQERGGKANTTEYWFLAQDVESILPAAVSVGADGYKSLNYIDFIPHLVWAVKDILAKNTSLSGLITSLTVSVTNLQSEMATINTTISLVQSNIGNLTSTIETLSNMADILVMRVTSTEQRITSIENSMNTTEQRIENTENQITSLSSANDSQSLVLTQMQDIVSDLQWELSTIQTNLTNSGTNSGETTVVNNYYTIIQTGSSNTGSDNSGTTIINNYYSGSTESGSLVWTHSGDLLSALTGSGMSGSTYTGTLITPRDAFLYISWLFDTSTDVIHDFISLQITAVHGYFDQIWAAKITTKKTITESLCVGTPNNSTCITKDQLDLLLLNMSQLPTMNTPSSPVIPENTIPGTGETLTGSTIPAEIPLPDISTITDTGSLTDSGIITP
jgi:hypothetical protein